MILNLGSLAFNANIESGGGTPAWGTELGQGEGYRFQFEGAEEFLTSMVYKSVPDVKEITCPLGKGGGRTDDYEFVLGSIYDKIYVNGIKIPDAKFILLVVKTINGNYHVGRRSLKYNPRMTYHGMAYNDDCYKQIPSILGIKDGAAWFIDEIFTNNQDELHFVAYVLDANHPKNYASNEERKKDFVSKINAEQEANNATRRYRHPLFNIDQPLQQIYYGAPGTGKSHEIKKTTDTMPIENVFRTTFHPDSDYSTFVGCYKPTMASHERLYSQGELISKLTEIKKSGVTYPVHKFSAKYWESLKELTNDETKAILTACGFTDSMNVEVGKGIAIGQELAGHSENKKITYEFVPQAFLKAYKRAYETDEPVVLVIEEINRGNCAQIFGDLFQLLDRKDGVSEYPIDADEDLRKYLIDTLGEDSPAIANGKLCLPSNLYIWATMNTSDQSLFPIDSAFKRRWEWKYTRIAQGKKEDGTLEHWKLENETDWWDFLKKINAIIDDMTQSADKQLGYYFCKPDKENDTISYARFVNKVLFYLWNDIFKTFGTDEYEQLFKIKRLKTDADRKWIEPHELEDKESKLTFPEFYDEKGDVIPEIAKQFIEKVIAWRDKPTTENA